MEESSTPTQKLCTDVTGAKIDGYREGRRRKGCRECNPYRRGSPEFVLWDAGFLIAKTQYYSVLLKG
jgi:hypothetical protein